MARTIRTRPRYFLEICEKHHVPHFYMPRSPMDLSYGYKRKCEDFVEAKHKTILKPS